MNLTDNEIIKALKHLHKRILKSSFAKYVTETEIMGLVDALDLINRQKAEIERLEAMHSEMCIGMKVLKRNAIKELAERVKGECEGGWLEIEESVFDNLVEEMVGEPCKSKVIHCGKCEFRNTDGFCFKNINGVGYKKVSAYDYCSYGKTKESE